MEKLLKKLLILLEDEIKNLQSMLPVFEKEKESVLKADFNELNKALAEKEKLLFNIRSLEKKRTYVMNKLAESLELIPDELTLKVLVQSVKEPYSTRLKNSGLQLSKLTKSISNANFSNKNIFAHSLKFIKSAINLLQNITAPGQVYHRTGMVKATHHSGKVLSGEI